MTDAVDSSPRGRRRSVRMKFISTLKPTLSLGVKLKLPRADQRLLKLLNRTPCSVSRSPPR
jgi:hypothetical protein